MSQLNFFNAVESSTQPMGKDWALQNLPDAATFRRPLLAVSLRRRLARKTTRKQFLAQTP